MTAALTAYEGEPVADGVVIEAPDGTRFATPKRAEQIDRRLRAQVGKLVGAAQTVAATLHEARTHNVHLMRGFDTWHDYVTDVFQDLRELRLNNRPEEITERRAIHASMHDAGLNITQIRERTGFARGSIHADLAKTGRAGHSKVIDITPEPQPPAPTGSVWEQAHEYLRRQGDRGLTRLELAAEAGWSDGKAGGVLVRLRRKRLATNTEDRRLDYEVFVYLPAEDKP